MIKIIFLISFKREQRLIEIFFHRMPKRFDYYSDNDFQCSSVSESDEQEEQAVTMVVVRRSPSPPKIIRATNRSWGCVTKPRTLSLLEIEEEEKRKEEEEKRKEEEEKRKEEEKRLERKQRESRLDLLCIFGPRHRCHMSHDLREWKPRLCKYRNCKNNESCIYMHVNEDIRHYLIRCCSNEKSFLFKNRNNYYRFYLN